MIYRIYCADFSGESNAVMTVDAVPAKSFIFAPDNTDYQTFKTQINADKAQLEDADGNLMTAEEAKQFVSTLP